MNIEEIITAFARISPARGGRWNVEPLAGERLFATRSEHGHSAVFLIGPLGSFGSVSLAGGLSHSDNVTVLPENTRITALKIECAGIADGERILAHIAYEFTRQLTIDSSCPNDVLLRQVGWLLSLLRPHDELMSSESQTGLIGECMFLRNLLLRAHHFMIPVARALETWKGHTKAKRDFFGSEIAVEIKTTSNTTRLHRISSMDQLAPHSPSETVFLYSIGIRRDASAPRKLAHFIEDVDALLVDQSGNPDNYAKDLFLQSLASYGLDRTRLRVYDAQPGYLAAHLTPALFRATELKYLTPNDFVGGHPPDTIHSISYALEVVAAPLSTAEVNLVLDRLLGWP